MQSVSSLCWWLVANAKAKQQRRCICMCGSLSPSCWQAEFSSFSRLDLLSASTLKVVFCCFFSLAFFFFINDILHWQNCTVKLPSPVLFYEIDSVFVVWEGPDEELLCGATGNFIAWVTNALKCDHWLLMLLSQTRALENRVNCVGKMLSWNFPSSPVSVQ